MHVAYVTVFLNLKVHIQGILLLCGLDQSGGSWDHWSSLQSLPLCWRHDWWHQFGGRVESVMWVVSMFCGSTCQLDVTPSDRRPLQVAPAQWEFQVGPASGTWRGKKMLLELLLWYVTIISIQNFLAKNLAYSKYMASSGRVRTICGWPAIFCSACVRTHQAGSISVHVLLRCQASYLRHFWQEYNVGVTFDPKPVPKQAGIGCLCLNPWILEWIFRSVTILRF